MIVKRHRRTDFVRGTSQKFMLRFLQQIDPVSLTGSPDYGTVFKDWSHQGIVKYNKCINIGEILGVPLNESQDAKRSVRNIKDMIIEIESTIHGHSKIVDNVGSRNTESVKSIQKLYSTIYSLSRK